MKLLALETGSQVAAIAAVELGEEIAAVPSTRVIAENRALARDLIGVIDAVLKEADWELSDLDGIGVGTGPGSWTSLRVGLSTAKTLAQAADIPLAGIPSFDGVAMSVLRQRMEREREAWDNGGARMLVVLSPCRPGEFYGKIFVVHEDSVSEVQSEYIAPLKSLLDAAYVQMMAFNFDSPLLVAGEAAEAAHEMLTQLKEWHEVIPVTSEDIATELAIAAAGRIDAGEADDCLSLVPLYLAPSNAERNLIKPVP